MPFFYYECTIEDVGNDTTEQEHRQERTQIVLIPEIETQE
jgi:hypothetical protein